MDTTITIKSKGVTNNSDFLHLTYNTGKNKDAIISLDSSNFGQSGSVSWDKKSSTLANIEKVTNWMKQSDKECVKSDLTQLVKKNEPEAKSLILVRCDFNKSTSSQSHFPSPFNRSTSLINYFKDENVTLTKKSKVPMSPKMDCDSKALKQESDCLHTVNEVPYAPLLKEDKNKSEHAEEVLSPESRKKELCRYLQLMNPADKKEIIILQNRRSTRVRNLAEQKQVQERLKEINDESSKEKCSESSEKSSTLKSFKELNIQIDKPEVQVKTEKYEFTFPFPPQQMMDAVNDFDDTMVRLVPKLKRRCRIMDIPFLTKTKPKKELKLLTPSKKKLTESIKNIPNTPKRIVNVLNTPKRGIKRRGKLLRSNGNLRDVPIKKVIDKNEKQLKKAKKVLRRSIMPTPQRFRKKSPAKSVSSHCEIISVGHPQDDDIDLDQFIDDMVDFDNLSDEHKKCLIESRILSTKTNPDKNVYSIQMSPLFGFSTSDTQKTSQICEKYKDSLKDTLKKDEMQSSKGVVRESEMEQEENQQVGGNTYVIVNIHSPDTSENKSGSSEASEQTGSSIQEHDYAVAPSKSSQVSDRNSDTEDLDLIDIQREEAHTGHCLEVNTKSISNNTKFDLLPFKTNNGKISLHKSLQFNTKKRYNLAANCSLAHEWDMHNVPKQQMKKQSHFISISSDNGTVLKAFYVGYNLIICQEYLISFWMQTPLGNVLGSQNMWVPRGQTQRIVLNNRCLQKDSMEKVICTDTSVVYIELWMKEHKSEMRQGPVADVFVTLYYWKQRQNGLEKKVLQLENINGFADDVQYCVLRNVPKIIVSWHSANEETMQMRRTFIHAYQLASDYQTLSNIYDIEPVDHYVSSLHNIEDYDDLIMGCGENKITLWNIEFGHIIATVELNDIKTPLTTLWVKCDRGFLFALQQCVDRELRLIAINGINHSWKKLASYCPPEGFDRLKGVCIENGLLLSFYDQGILCWNAETGEPVEEINLENDIIPSGTYVILLEDNQIIVKHALTHLMSISVEES